MIWTEIYVQNILPLLSFIGIGIKATICHWLSTRRGGRVSLSAVLRMCFIGIWFWYNLLPDLMFCCLGFTCLAPPPPPRLSLSLCLSISLYLYLSLSLSISLSLYLSFSLSISLSSYLSIYLYIYIYIHIYIYIFPSISLFFSLSLSLYLSLSLSLSLAPLLPCLSAVCIILLCPHSESLFLPLRLFFFFLLVLRGMILLKLIHRPACCIRSQTSPPRRSRTTLTGTSVDVPATGLSWTPWSRLLGMPTYQTERP